MATTSRYSTTPVTRTFAIIVVIWLVIGAIAAGQRHYYSGSTENCAKAGTIAVTIIAGPLNYLGANPKLNCDLPQPSK
jgi:membrane protein YdbS with pleckstrin-like domain